jgi:hypothetical protein
MLQLGYMPAVYRPIASVRASRNRGDAAGYNYVKIFDPTGGRNCSRGYSRQYERRKDSETDRRKAQHRKLPGFDEQMALNQYFFNYLLSEMTALVV